MISFEEFCEQMPDETKRTARQYSAFCAMCKAFRCEDAKTYFEGKRIIFDTFRAMDDAARSAQERGEPFPGGRAFASRYFDPEPLLQWKRSV